MQQIIATGGRRRQGRTDGYGPDHHAADGRDEARRLAEDHHALSALRGCGGWDGVDGIDAALSALAASEGQA